MKDRFELDEKDGQWFIFDNYVMYCVAGPFKTLEGASAELYYLEDRYAN